MLKNYFNKSNSYGIFLSSTAIEKNSSTGNFKVSKINKKEKDFFFFYLFKTVKVYINVILSMRNCFWTADLKANIKK